MGQILRVLAEGEEPPQLIFMSEQYQPEEGSEYDDEPEREGEREPRFPDLEELPPEISLSILRHLNATDLCLAACVWQSLATDEILWMGLCKQSWSFCSVYYNRHNIMSYRKLYMLLDEATLTFNADCEMGVKYLVHKQLIADVPEEIARFLHGSRQVDQDQKQKFLEKRKDVLRCLVQLHNYQKEFLPNALRRFFGELKAPSERNDYLSAMLECFSRRFINCNPDLGLNEDTVYIICFSLILLSVDLCSPCVKNKMSKREFIRNLRHAAHGVNDEYTGHLYDNIYLVGHVAQSVR